MEWCDFVYLREETNKQTTFHHHNNKTGFGGRKTKVGWPWCSAVSLGKQLWVWQEALIISFPLLLWFTDIVMFIFGKCLSLFRLLKQNRLVSVWTIEIYFSQFGAWKLGSGCQMVGFWWALFYMADFVPCSHMGDGARDLSGPLYKGTNPREVSPLMAYSFTCQRPFPLTPSH